MKSHTQVVNHKEKSRMGNSVLSSLYLSSLQLREKEKKKKKKEKKKRHETRMELDGAGAAIMSK